MLFRSKVSFLEPISLKKLMSNKEIRENFLRLKLLKDSVITFENDIGSTLEDAAAIVDFLKELKSARPTVKIRPIQFQIIQKEHKGEAGK